MNAGGQRLNHRRGVSKVQQLPEAIGKVTSVSNERGQHDDSGQKLPNREERLSAYHCAFYR